MGITGFGKNIFFFSIDALLLPKGASSTVNRRQSTVSHRRQELLLPRWNLDQRHVLQILVLYF